MLTRSLNIYPAACLPADYLQQQKEQWQQEVEAAHHQLVTSYPKGFTAGPTPSKDIGALVYRWYTRGYCDYLPTYNTLNGLRAVIPAALDFVSTATTAVTVGRPSPPQRGGSMAHRNFIQGGTGQE